MVGPLDVLQDVVERFDKVGIEYFLVGSLASMHYGRPRFTHDVDLVVEIKATQVSEFEKLFNIEEYYCPPSEVIRDEVVRMGSFNLIHQESGIKVDVVLRKNTEFYASEFGRRKKAKLTPAFEAYIASVEDVIIKKLDFYREGGSEKHLTDIREMIMGNSVDKAYIQKWLNHFGLQAEWEKL
jgi:hypothetical protein